jgi:hypothetical protein
VDGRRNRPCCSSTIRLLGVWIAPRSPHDILAGGQIVSSSENLHGQILRGTAVTRLRRHDDMRVEDAAAARDCLRLMAAMASLLLLPPGSEEDIMKVFGTSSPVST